MIGGVTAEVARTPSGYRANGFERSYIMLIQSQGGNSFIDKNSEGWVAQHKRARVCSVAHLFTYPSF